MPGGFTVKLEGFDEVIKKLDTKTLEPDVTAVLKNFGQQVARDAQQNVEINGTTDRGFLVNRIGSESTAPLSVSIFAAADYAAYIEFGTRKFAAVYVATLPADWKTFAATFRGKAGGSFADLIKAITAWVLRKGIGASLTKTGKASKSKDSLAAQKNAAYLIARKIARDGIKAQPFMFPAFEKNRPILIQDLKDLLNDK